MTRNAGCGCAGKSWATGKQSTAFSTSQAQRTNVRSLFVPVTVVGGHAINLYLLCGTVVRARRERQDAWLPMSQNHVKNMGNWGRGAWRWCVMLHSTVGLTVHGSGGVEVFGVGPGVESVLRVSCPARAAVLADPAAVAYVEQSVWLLRVVLSARFHPPLPL